MRLRGGDVRSSRHRFALGPTLSVCEVLTPSSAKDPAFQEGLRELAPDACPVVAYGALLPRAALDIPGHGWVNLHFSLLPAWRGAAPVQRAVIAGDDVTGASTFLIEEGLDTGPVFGTMTETVRPTDTAGDLLGRLAVAAPGCSWPRWTVSRTACSLARNQPAEGVSLAPKLTVDDARVDWAPARARRPSGSGMYAEPRRVDDVPRRAGQGARGPADRRRS